ncbi:hypothetical protein L5D93_29455 [Paenibacillus thiaminolyticus]|nr:hypothetical protein [Paenibacillus thiaminolyticus]
MSRNSCKIAAIPLQQPDLCNNSINWTSPRKERGLLPGRAEAAAASRQRNAEKRQFDLLLHGLNLLFRIDRSLLE